MSTNSPNRTDLLQMIQDVVTRLARESANVKTWTVAIFAGISLVARTGGTSLNRSWPYWILGAVVVLLLGMLDAYYLGLERAYRALYEERAVADEPSWSLQLPAENPWTRFRRATADGIKSPIVVCFYGALVFALLLLAGLTRG